MDTNTFSYRNVYPGAMGSTIATGATGSNTNAQAPGRGGVPMTDEANPLDRALQIGSKGNAIIGAVILLVMVVGLMFLAKRLGTDEDFKSIRPTIYNGLTISAAAIIFMPLWKIAFTKLPVPGVSTWVLAA